MNQRDKVALVLLHALVSRSDGIAAAVTSFGAGESVHGREYLRKLRAACYGAADSFLAEDRAGSQDKAVS